MAKKIFKRKLIMQFACYTNKSHRKPFSRIYRQGLNHIGNAPGACARRSNRDLGKWLRQLDTLLEAYPDSYEWRAMHLAASPSGVVPI